MKNPIMQNLFFLNQHSIFRSDLNTELLQVSANSV